MKRTYQAALLDECVNATNQINDIVSKHMPQDLFCEVNRELLINDIQSNLLIRHSPSIVCIVEYSTRSYLYVSENILTELDITVEELMSVGMARALMNFEEKQRKIFLEELCPIMFEYFAKYAPLNEAKDLHISYNTLLKTASGEYEWYFHQLSVLACDEKGFPRYAMKFLSNIQGHKKDETLNFSIHKKAKGHEPELIFSKTYMAHELSNKYSPREKEILQLVSRGHTTKSIAEILHLSDYTVSTHRKNIAKKMK